MKQRQAIDRIRALARAIAITTLAGAAACSLPTDASDQIPSVVVIVEETLELSSLGTTVELTARVLDQRGKEMRGVPLVWSSLDAAVLEHVAESTFRATGNGSATVQVSVEHPRPRVGEDGYHAGIVRTTVSVIVKQRLESISLSTPSTTLWAVGQSGRMRLEMRDAGGHALARSLPVIWSSADEAIATVDPEGVVTARGDGTVEIVAVVEGRETTASIRVAARVPFTGCLSYGGAAREQCATVEFIVRDT